jgi:hypothetical protein
MTGTENATGWIVKEVIIKAPDCRKLQFAFIFADLFKGGI